MTATVRMVPLQKIKPRDGFNPRADFDGERMAELVESVRQHGIITPLTLAPDGDGFVIVAGKRRAQAWREQQAKLAEQRAKLAAGEAVRCACCFQPIGSPGEAAETKGSLVHAGDCEPQWGSACEEPEGPEEEPER